MRKLKRSEVPHVRNKLQVKQGHKCALCPKSLKQFDPVLDHDHDTGSVRAVLCRNCNGMEGKVRTAAIRAAGKEGAAEWLQNLANYWAHFEQNPSPLMYPSHKTEEEKRLDRNARARKARAAKKKVSK